MTHSTNTCNASYVPDARLCYNRKTKSWLIDGSLNKWFKHFRWPNSFDILLPPDPLCSACLGNTDLKLLISSCKTDLSVSYSPYIMCVNKYWSQTEYVPICWYSLEYVTSSKQWKSRRINNMNNNFTTRDSLTGKNSPVSCRGHQAWLFSSHFLLCLQS